MASPLKKALSISFILHLIILFLGLKGMSLILGLLGVNLTVDNDKVDIPIVDISVIEISNQTNIPVIGEDGGNEAPQKEDVKKEEPALPDEPKPDVLKETKNEAPEVVEENKGDEDAPVENVDAAGSNLTQADISDSLSEDVFKIINESNDPPEENKKEKETSPYKWDIPVSDVVVKNRPATLKNLANKEEAAPKPSIKEKSETQPSAGKIGPNLDDILGTETANSASGVPTATVKSAVKGRLYQCYSRPGNYQLGRQYTIPIRITFNALGQITNSSFKPGYQPKDDVELARANSAINAARNPNCNLIEIPNYHFSDGQILDISFD